MCGYALSESLIQPKNLRASDVGNRPIDEVKVMRVVRLGDTLMDLRFGARMLRRKPGFTAVILITLAIGIGASVATFSIADAAIFKSLPFPNPGRLTAVWESSHKELSWSKMWVSYRDFREWRRSNHTFDGMAAYTWAVRNRILSGWGQPQNATVLPASFDFFSVLRVRAQQGRTFEPSDESNPSVLVLSHRGWMKLFGGAADIVGKNVGLDGQSYTVIGVMPQNFEMYPKETDAWTLLTQASDVVKDPMNHIVAVVGRMKPGVSTGRAADDLAVARKRVNDEQPDALKDIGVVVNGLQDDYVWFAGRNLKSALLAVLGAVLLILLIGCLNVANLLLGRGSDRRKEMAIRAALGSGRGRLIRQLVTESLALSVIGAGLGILLAGILIRLFNSKAPVELPPDTVVALNARVLLFAVALSVVTGVMFGIVPAFQSSKTDLNEAPKESGRGSSGARSRRRLSNLLVVAEIALALLLVAGAGLLIESATRYAGINPGFRTRNLLTMKVALPPQEYSSPDKIRTFYDRLLDNLRALPGIKGASAIQWLPIESGGGGLTFLTVAGRPVPAYKTYDVAQERIADDYFETMGIPLIKGRYLNRLDRSEAGHVAVVSEALAREYFPGEDPIGKQAKVGGEGWTTVVGVVGDVKYNNVFKEMSVNMPPIIYRSSASDPVGQGQTLGAQMSVVIRTAGPPEALSAEAIGEVRKLDPVLPPPSTEAMAQVIDRTLAQPRLRAALALVFSGLALFLAALGIYGVLSRAVSERTHELGIRMALGAKRSDVLKMVVGQGLVLAISGIALGLCGAIAATRLIASLLFEARPNDPVTLAGVAVFLGVVAMAACSIPAYRATKVDPGVALRFE